MTQCIFMEFWIVTVCRGCSSYSAGLLFYWRHMAWLSWSELGWAGHLVPFGFCCPLFIMAYTTFLPSCSFMVLWLRHINKIFVLFFALLPFCPSVNLFSWKFMTFCKKNYSFGNHDLRFLINIHIYVALAYFCFNWNFLRIF